MHCIKSIFRIPIFSLVVFSLFSISLFIYSPYSYSPNSYILPIRILPNHIFPLFVFSPVTYSPLKISSLGCFDVTESMDQCYNVRPHIILSTLERSLWEVFQFNNTFLWRYNILYIHSYLVDENWYFQLVRIDLHWCQTWPLGSMVCYRRPKPPYNILGFVQTFLILFRLSL